jgi:hypothetical protein
MNYKNLIKHNNNLEQPISITELELLEKRYDVLNAICYDDDFWIKYSEKEQIELNTERKDLFAKLKIQRIIARPEYFEKIVQCEQSLTNVLLTDKENELLQKILNHPNLEGLIEYHGIELIEGYY